VLGADRARTVQLQVFCPRRAATVSIDVCEHCPRLDAIDTLGDCPSVACEGGSVPGVREPVGALVRSAVLCVRSDVPLEDLDPDDGGSHLIPVVGESEQYLGSIVRGRSSFPPPRASEAARLRDHLTAEVAVVNNDRKVVGVLDDIALLTSAARTRPASADRDRPASGARLTRARRYP
jgi:hypothetical protein